MIEPIKIEGEKNRELKQKVNYLILENRKQQEVIEELQKNIANNNRDIAWWFKTMKDGLDHELTPPSPTSPHSGESLNGLVSPNRFTVQTASQESVDPSVLEHDEPEEPVGTVRELGNGFVDVKRERGWERMKEDEYLKQTNG